MLAGLILDYAGVLTDPGADASAGYPLVGAVRLARSRGLRTGLLSNADEVSPEIDQELFDTVLLSGELGFGKPDPRIYLLAASRLELAPEDCVFVDDLVSNVRGAAGVGMVGVHHEDVCSTLAELTVLFGFPFS